MWHNHLGEESPDRADEVLVVAPYNAQVALIKAALPAGARVGTVDKFQGQEAPVVIYSMTSTSADDAPRGVSFLYDLNRLNVAVSRAQALACRRPEPVAARRAGAHPGPVAPGERAVPAGGGRRRRLLSSAGRAGRHAETASAEVLSPSLRPALGESHPVREEVHGPIG